MTSHALTPCTQLFLIDRTGGFGSLQCMPSIHIDSIVAPFWDYLKGS